MNSLFGRCVKRKFNVCLRIFLFHARDNLLLLSFSSRKFIDSRRFLDCYTLWRGHTRAYTHELTWSRILMNFSHLHLMNDMCREIFSFITRITHYVNLSSLTSFCHSDTSRGKSIYYLFFVSLFNVYVDLEKIFPYPKFFKFIEEIAASYSNLAS